MLADSKVAHLLLAVKKDFRFQVSQSMRKKNVTGLKQRLNAYLAVGLAVYKTSIPVWAPVEEYISFFLAFQVKMSDSL